MLDLEKFKQNYLVTGLTEAQIKEIADLATLRRLTAQEFLIRTGEAGNEFYVVLAGRLVVLTKDGDKLSEVGPGTVLGEMSLIDAMPRTADVVAIGMVDVAVIPAQELRKKMSQNREWGFTLLANLARVLTGRLRHANQMIDELNDKAANVWDRAL